uniref:Uncharacterized protein n=1 Tax=Leersia perrieri TaxID=77586 RepID=A0A0D9V8Z4_9ORYZ
MIYSIAEEVHFFDAICACEIDYHIVGLWLPSIVAGVYHNCFGMNNNVGSSAPSSSGRGGSNGNNGTAISPGELPRSSCVRPGKCGHSIQMAAMMRMKIQTILWKKKELKHKRHMDDR